MALSPFYLGFGINPFLKEKRHFFYTIKNLHKISYTTFGYIAIKQMGYSGREVGRFLNMRSYSAIRRPARFAFDSENNFK